MSLVLKMKLEGATANLLSPEDRVTYSLRAVHGDSNAPWSKFTPSGSLQFDVTNPDCPKLEAGDYLVTLTKVDAASAPKTQNPKP